MKATVKYAISLGVVVAGACVASAGCLTRPVVAGEPVTQTNVSFAVQNETISKIDMLFDIDNSASMGDKQAYLTAAIPDLVNRLVNPNCLDGMGNVQGSSTLGTCPAGQTPEFPAVRDMHLGIVSSSLGTRLSDTDTSDPNPICASGNAAAPFGTVNSHTDDQGHLLARSLTYGNNGATATEGTVGDANIAAYTPQPSGFLYWYPTGQNGMGINGAPVGPAKPLQQAGMPPNPAAGTLENDFQQMVSGVGTFGCGIESQMESWYRFLIQPDPYQSLATDPTNTAGGAPAAIWQGVDATILKERHDFLRPDSLVAVVVLSDENDSEIDVRSLGGIGYYFMRGKWPPTRGTSACATDPLNQNNNTNACHSCGSQAGDANDANCKLGAYNQPNDWGFDPNLRHVHMRIKYGIDPQFPIERYFVGLTSQMVPDRTGEYPTGASEYQGGLFPDANNPNVQKMQLDCLNPLYAASLPDGTATDAKTICNASGTVGPRTVDQVFFVHIGGVPWQLLHFQANNPTASTLTQADWVRILGTDPERYNYNGIDPHMYESYMDRTALTNPPTFDTSLTNALSPPTAASNADPVNGREWITDQQVGAAGAAGSHVLSVDREYACTFPLLNPRDCTLPQNSAYACDCPSANNGTLNHQQTPSVCSDTNPTSQIAAKAYPTERELLLAKMMGNQGVVSSICPEHTADNANGNDPLYGYRPAVAAIIDRLKKELTTECLPHKLTPNSSDAGAAGGVPCLLLVTMPAVSGQTCKNPTCPADQGLIDLRSDPSFAPGQGQTLLDQFCDSEEANYTGKAGAPGDPALQSVCEAQQLTQQANGNDFSNGSCAGATNDLGWCYVTGTATSKCSQEIDFTPHYPPSGSTTTLSCLEQSQTVVGTSADGGN